MKFPIKLNKRFWPKILTYFLPSANDPSLLINDNLNSDDFSKAVSVLKFGKTYKATKSDRFPMMISALNQLTFINPPVILDVGASDGTASLQLINNLDHSKYYLTDSNIEVIYQINNRIIYFYDLEYNCILIVTKRFVIYPDIQSSIFPINKFGSFLFKNAPKITVNNQKIKLINPELKCYDERIVFQEYDILKSWPFEKIDVLLAANILNRSYFTDDNILIAINNFIACLNDSAILAIVENRNIEKGSIFSVVGNKIELVKDINGGTEIKELILKYNIK